jgi:preprotein translocase subunit SecD
MNKNLGWKLGVSVATLVIFILGIIGIPRDWSGKGLLAAMQQRINLGLDLKGGTHLILQVQVNDAVNVDSDIAVETLKQGFRTRKINYADISKPDPANPDRIVIKGVPPEGSSDLRSIVDDRMPEYNAVSSADNSWTISMKPQALTELKDHAVQQAIETIRNRIDALGVVEPTVAPYGLGDYQILVQLPGIDDPARVREVMQSTAMLEIRQALGGPYASEQEALQANGGVLPADAVLMPGKASGANGAPTWYLVSRVAAVTGRDLRDASASQDENGQPAVGFNLTNEGGQKFYAFDSGIIKGRFTEQEVKDQSMILRSGALPASIKYIEDTTIGPSLGADSIRAGVTAAVIGMLAVLIFMLVYYHGAGVNADIALILNLIILLGFMGYSTATLTLPGIAGVVLTVGMGVDSNVLIFERIREELRNGKTPPSAVEQGFGHAWITIVDTHVTTIVSAAILFLFGTGPIQGFATTLVVGLFANLFTAVFVSRMIFDWVLSRHQRGEALSIG